MAQKPKVTWRVSKFDRQGRMVGTPERFLEEKNARKRALALKKLGYQVEVDEMEVSKLPRGWH